MIELKITVPDRLDAHEIDGYLRSALAALGYEKSGNVANTAAGKLVDRIRNAETSTGVMAAASEVVRDGELKTVIKAAIEAAVADLPPPPRGTTAEQAHADLIEDTNGLVVKDRDGEEGIPATEEQIAAAPKRERGKPDPASGRSRRTKAEIAEDDAADAADAAAAAAGATSDEDGEAQASSENDAVLAATPADTAEVVDQDAADEAAESAKAAETKPLATLLLEQIRKVMGEIGRKHGIPLAAQIPAYLGKPIAQFGEAELPDVLKKVTTLLKLDTDTASMLLGDAESGTTDEPATETAPDETVELRKSEHPPTAEELIKALYRYADFADGTRDQQAMVHTMADCPQMFLKAFGVEKRSEIPAEKLGEAIALIDDAIATDRFKRKRS